MWDWQWRYAILQRISARRMNDIVTRVHITCPPCLSGPCLRHSQLTSPGPHRDNVEKVVVIELKNVDHITCFTFLSLYRVPAPHSPQLKIVWVSLLHSWYDPMDQICHVISSVNSAASPGFGLRGAPTTEAPRSRHRRRRGGEVWGGGVHTSSDYEVWFNVASSHSGVRGGAQSEN